MKQQGIYILKNLNTFKVYVGQSTDLERRERDHFNYLRQNKHTNKRLQHSFNKHGEDSFLFEIIELVEFKSDLTGKEQFWMDYYDSYYNGYNQTIAADSTVGIPKTEETKKVLSEKLTEYWSCPEIRQAQSERKKSYFANTPDAISKASDVMLKVHADNPQMAVTHALKMSELFSQPERVNNFNRRMSAWRSTLTASQKSEIGRKATENRTAEDWARSGHKSKVTRITKWLEGTSDIQNVHWQNMKSRQGKIFLAAVCRWTDADDTKRIKMYSTNVYGLIPAWYMACKYRENVVRPSYQEFIDKQKE